MRIEEGAEARPAGALRHSATGLTLAVPVLLASGLGCIATTMHFCHPSEASVANSYNMSHRFETPIADLLGRDPETDAREAPGCT